MNPAFERHLENNVFLARWEKAQTNDEKCSLCEEFLKKHKAANQRDDDPLERFVDHHPNLRPLPPPPPSYTGASTYVAPNKVDIITMQTEISHFWLEEKRNSNAVMEQAGRDLREGMMQELLNKGYVKIDVADDIRTDSKRIGWTIKAVKP